MKFRVWRTVLIFLAASTLIGCSKELFTLRPGEATLASTGSIPAQFPTLTSAPTSTAVVDGTFCSYSNGSVSEVQVLSKVMTHPLTVKMYLPPCYNINRDPGYPVLYMLHGQTYDEGQWQRLGLLSAADELITAGRITPMIIVMPYDVSWSAGPEVSTFDESLLMELIPYVDQNFNTCSLRTCRAVGGLSRGGNWAVYLGFSHPELFIAIGAHSAPLFYGEIQRMTSVLKTDGAIARLPDIYIDAGNKDENLSQVLTYVTLLKKYNVPYVFTEYQGYHSEDYWSKHAADYLLWYSAEFTSTQEK